MSKLRSIPRWMKKMAEDDSDDHQSDGGFGETGQTSEEKIAAYPSLVKAKMIIPGKRALEEACKALTNKKRKKKPKK